MGFVLKSAMVLGLAVLSCAGFAAADTGSLETATKLYASGDYAQAAHSARALPSARANALAARALLAQARFAPRSERAVLVEAARTTAASAISRDPAIVEGHLQLAVALGFQGRAVGNYFAHQQGLATEARAAIDAALALEPENAWALALSGTWHLEIVNGAGPLLASALYDANRAAGISHIRQAVSAHDVSVIVLHQCALQLLAHDTRAFGEEAERILLAAGHAQVATAFERHTQRQADRLLRAYRSGSDSMLRREITREQMTY